MSTEKYIAAFLYVFLIVGHQAAFAGIAGNVQFVNGSVQVTSAAARTQVLQKGDAVNESDTVTTAKGASAQIRMRDGGFIVIRPDSQLKFDSFIFNGKEDGSERSFFSLIKGGMRAITGLIGQKNKSNYRIATTTSTIAIRGTDHETFVVLPDSPLAAVAPAGTYNKVNLGETAIINAIGSIPVMPNQMGFAGAADQMPQLLPMNLNIFTVTPSPLAQAQGGQVEVRDGVVVDSAIEGQEAATGSALPKNNIQIPITGRSGGKAAIPILF
ncbi:MAG TPA: FecR domain-containing protein [Gallionellaceae bacterium]|nr:FecR domain-containing protein [Gallionellaceae bacterium]